MRRLEGIKSSIAVACHAGSGLFQGAVRRQSLGRRRGLERDEHSCYERSHAGRSPSEAVLVIEALAHIPMVNEGVGTLRKHLPSPEVLF